MSNPHFISYSTTEAQDFALRLTLDLQGGAPPFSIWLDKNQIDPGRDWETQIAEAIRDFAP